MDACGRWQSVGTFHGQSGTGQCLGGRFVGLLMWPFGPLFMRVHMAGARVGDAWAASLNQRLSVAPSVLRVGVVRKRRRLLQILTHFCHACRFVVLDVFKDHCDLVSCWCRILVVHCWCLLQFFWGDEGVRVFVQFVCVHPVVVVFLVLSFVVVVVVVVCEGGVRVVSGRWFRIQFAFVWRA